MRETFHLDLQQILDDLVSLTSMAQAAIARATGALVAADVQLAETVIADDVLIDALREQIDTKAVDLLARQAPVATDLRIIVTAMRISAEVERMGDLARHIAAVARARYPEHVVPADITEVFAAMGAAAEEICQAAAEALRSLDGEAAARIERLDDTLDAQQLDLAERVVQEDWPHSMQAAVDTTLVSRFYERFGDHAVTIARRVKYLVTGEPASLGPMPDRTPGLS